MSAKITGMVWDLDLPRMEIQILLAMADHAQHDGTRVFPSQALIAWKTGYSIRQVRRVQDILKRRKILIPEGLGYRGVQHYRLDFSTAPLKPPFVTRDSMSSEDKMSVVNKPHVNKLLRSTTDKMSSVVTSTTDKMSSVVTTDKMSSEDIYDTTTDILSTSHYKDARAEPSLEPSVKETTKEEEPPTSPTGGNTSEAAIIPKRPRAPRKPKDTPTYDPEGYERFLATYPRRKGLDAALKAWETLKPDPTLQAIILADIPNRVANDESWIQGYIPWPGKYLNERRWREDILPLKLPRASPTRRGEPTADEIRWHQRREARKQAGRQT